MAKDNKGFDPFAGEDIKAPGAGDVGGGGSSGSSGNGGGADPFADLDIEAAESRHDYEDAAVSKMNEETSRIVKSSSSGKKLWTCPHCGAKNKPSRQKCRSCGKSPDDAVAIWRQKWFPFAVLAVLIVGICFAFIGGGPSFDRKPASAAGLDHQARVNKAGGEDKPIGEAVFKPGGQFAVCGRVLSVEPKKEGDTAVVSVFLALGRKDTVGKQNNFERLSPLVMEHKIDLNFDGKAADRDLYWYCLVHVVDEDGSFDPRYGQYVSLTGLHGTVADWGDWSKFNRSHEYIVWPTRMVTVADP